MHPYVHNSNICNSQDMEATQVPTDRWMNKEDVEYIYSVMWLKSKKDNAMSFAAIWLDLEIIILSEVN